jgi:hypothetical protein
MADGNGKLLPVGRFYPAPGLSVDRTENLVSITGRMELYGPEATVARAASIQQVINSTWTTKFGDGYSVTCQVNVKYRPFGVGRGNATQIEAAKIVGFSHVSPGLRGRTMTLNANEPDAFSWTPAHEFGHILGMKDRYSESIMSRIRGSFGGARSATTQSGYQGNLMAERGGALASKNVADLASENAPSPYWINDDDEVSAWVNAHPLTDIRNLSTNNKMRAIWTLLGGWISDDDMTAIRKICGSVTTRMEADVIRKGVDPLVFSDIGQRTRFRVIIGQLP